MAYIKIIIIFATCFSVATSFALDYSIGILPYKVTTNLRNAWKLCPEKNGTEDSYEGVFNNATSCYNRRSGAQESICFGFRNNLRRCSQPIVDFLAECLPAKSKDLPQVVVESAEAIAETFCTSSGEILIESFNACIYQYFDQTNKLIKEECKEEAVRLKLEKFTNEVPSKLEACQVGREVGICWQEYVNEHCGASVTKQFFSRFYNAVFSACKE